MTNGAVGTLYAGSSYSGATVVDLTSGYVEFQDASGVRHICSTSAFTGFDFSEYSTPLDKKAKPGASIIVGGSTLTLVDIRDGLLEYTDSSGAGHVLPWGWSATLS